MFLPLFCRWLIADAAAGDSLFMHYSGELGLESYLREWGGEVCDMVGVEAQVLVWCLSVLCFFLRVGLALYRHSGGGSRFAVQQQQAVCTPLP